MTASSVPLTDSANASHNMRTHSIGGIDIPVYKLAFGDPNTETVVTATEPYPVRDVPYAGNGTLPHHAKAAATDNATVVSAVAATLYDGHVYNANAALRYLKFYDKASTPSNSDTPKHVIPLKPQDTTMIRFSKGLAFAAGLSYRIVTGLADNDNVAPSANDVIVNFSYK